MIEISKDTAIKPKHKKMILKKQKGADSVIHTQIAIPIHIPSTIRVEIKKNRVINTSIK